MKILLIEDDIHTGEVIQKFLRDENLFCDFTTTADEALQISRVYNYDVIILDLDLPDMSGHDLLHKFRDSAIRAPILILSGLQSIQDKVRALGFGADDYMTKPFMSEELIVRIKALARRADGHHSAIIRVGELELNADSQIILARGEVMDLTSKEYQILSFLLMKRGATVTKAHFLNRLYSGMDEPEDKIIDVFICKIRKKLKKILGAQGHHYIETVWGRGYVLREPTGSERSNDGISEREDMNLSLVNEPLPANVISVR